MGFFKPSMDMLEWEENVFLGIKALYRRLWVRPQEQRREAVRACLVDERARLLYLGQMVAGTELAVFETDHRRLYQGDRLFLPGEWSAGDSPELNRELYALKTIVAALARREGWRAGEVDLPAAVARHAAEFPRLAERLAAADEALGEEQSLWELLGTLPEAADQGAAEAVLPVAPDPSDATAVTTEVEGKGQVDVEVLPGSDDDGAGADLATHTFEKAETLDEYNGLSRKTDDEDELEDHAEALEEVDMRHVVRSAERPRSIYRSDLILDGINFEVESAQPAAGIPYPEWDYKKRSYRPRWCFLTEHREQEAVPAWGEATHRTHTMLVQQLKRQFASLTTEWLELKRQVNGPEFDLDAVVNAQVERRVGQTPTERIYTDRQRELHDVAAVLLLDLSYSTDAWLQRKRVLDTIRETVFCVGEVLEDFIEGFAVAGFSSNTRRSCRFELIKDFADPWDATKDKLGSLTAEGYTRIGPALRHAQELLINQRAQRKVVILVTDGRPCDYDRYEGRYGIEDVKKAIEVGRDNQIATHAFAIEKQAAESFPRMFSRRHFDVVSSPESLTRCMCGLFARLIRG
jgi:nitric oxide reductase NorD protein